MTGSSILPVAIYKGKLYFLFGKENEMEDSAHGFSDFGGGVDAGEDIYETALREGSEELTGFLGNSMDLKRLIRKNGGVFKLVYTDDKTEDPMQGYHVHIFNIEYDKNLPIYYNANHSFLWNLMDKHMLNDSKLFEKIEIKWVCETDLKKKMGMYRSFYKNVVNLIVDNLDKIRKFICERARKTKKRELCKSMRGGGKTHRNKLSTAILPTSSLPQHIPLSSSHAIYPPVSIIPLKRGG